LFGQSLTCLEAFCAALLTCVCDMVLLLARRLTTSPAALQPARRMSAYISSAHFAVPSRSGIASS
jgi:hypothetical protein